MVSSNVSGVVTIKNGAETIASEKAVGAGKIIKVPARIANKAKTNFSIMFLPDDTQYLTSYDNSDPSQNNADGFAAKLTSGVGNVFDGWDLYTKSGLSAIGAVHIKNSMTYGNGRLTDGKDKTGDGNVDLRTYDHITPDFKAEGVISYQNKYNVKDVYQLTTDSDTNFIFDGQVSKNSSSDTLTDGNFKSLDSKIPYERDEDGNIIWGDFLQVIK